MPGIRSRSGIRWPGEIYILERANFRWNAFRCELDERLKIRRPGQSRLLVILGKPVGTELTLVLDLVISDTLISSFVKDHR
jgi:hypothetical protein